MHPDDKTIREMFFNIYKYYVETYRDHSLDYSFHPALPIDELDYKAYDAEAYQYATKIINEYLRSPVYASDFIHN